MRNYRNNTFHVLWLLFGGCLELAERDKFKPNSGRLKEGRERIFLPRPIQLSERVLPGKRMFVGKCRPCPTVFPSIKVEFLHQALIKAGLGKWSHSFPLSTACYPKSCRRVGCPQGSLNLCATILSTRVGMAKRIVDQDSVSIVSPAMHAMVLIVWHRNGLGTQPWSLQYQTQVLSREQKKEKFDRSCKKVVSKKLIEEDVPRKMEKSAESLQEKNIERKELKTVI